MPENDSSDESIDWDTDDELELEFFQEAGYDQAAISSTSSQSRNPGVVDHFVAMGFDKKMVVRAVKNNDEEDTEGILNCLLSYPHPENDSSDKCIDWDTDDELELEFLQEAGYDQAAISSLSSQSRNPGVVDHFVAMGFDKKMVVRAVKDNDEEDTKAILNCLLSYPKDVPKDSLSLLTGMGYRYIDAREAIKQCGSKASLDELTDFIFAAQTATIYSSTPASSPRKRKLCENSLIERPRKRAQRRVDLRGLGTLDNKMIGFGVPGCSLRITSRVIPKSALGPPFFYYENVALTPKGVWEEISRYLYDIEPEFVDSLHFSAAARKRGYIHNLPIENRQPLLPIPPKTIHEALPDTKKWWPAWDTRTKFNCLLTCIGSAPLSERIKRRIESGSPSECDKTFVVNQCKKWNLVWVGKNKVAPLEPGDMELMLGFPPNHTRGVSRTDRYKSLGNTFQIDTVAYHLSVLKPIYPEGMTVLSLFSGIGGAEVALHRLGIPLKTVVSVEKSDVNRNILQDWWEQTEQKGRLIHVDDVQKVSHEMIRQWIEEFGGFDLVIGGSPCNNLAGGNRRTRDGLLGEHSSLFFHYYRILDAVRTTMRGRSY